MVVSVCGFEGISMVGLTISEAVVKIGSKW